MSIRPDIFWRILVLWHKGVISYDNRVGQPTLIYGAVVLTLSLSLIRFTGYRTYGCSIAKSIAFSMYMKKSIDSM